MIYPSLYKEPVKLAELPGSRSKHKLEGKPDTWPQQLLQALYTDHPFLAEREVSVRVKRLDNDTGYAIGYFSIGGIGDAVQIPFVVRNRLVLPFAVFLDDTKAYPLTEERFLSHTLPEAGVQGIKFRDRDIEHMVGDQEWEPPDHTSYLGNQRLISKLSHIPVGEFERFKKALERPEYEKVSERVSNLPWFQNEKIAKSQERDYDDIHYSGDEPIESWVGDSEIFAEVTEHRHRFSVTKFASMGEPGSTRIISSPELKQLFGEDALSKISTYKRLILNLDEPEKTAEHPLAAPERANRPGTWSVKKVTGEPIVGTVITKVVDFDNLQLPFKVFYNGSESAVQDEIAGSFVGEINLPPTQLSPKGECVFMFRNENGLIFCTIPFVVEGEVPARDEEGWVVETYLGDRVILVRADIKRMVEIDKGVYGIPSMYSLVSLGSPENRVQLVEDPKMFSTMERIASNTKVASVTPWNGGYAVKLGEHKVPDCNTGQAIWWLKQAGVRNPEVLLKQADTWGKSRAEFSWDHFQSRTKFANARKEEGRRLEGLQKHADSVFANLRTDPETIVHVASWMLENQGMGKLGELPERTVDDVLTIGFVSPANTRTFLDHMDDLEESAGKLAELVLASQIGYSEIPEEESMTAMYALEKVLAGLRKLKTLS